jgi:hypothetical protein
MTFTLKSALLECKWDFSTTILLQLVIEWNSRRRLTFCDRLSKSWLIHWYDKGSRFKGTDRLMKELNSIRRNLLRRVLQVSSNHLTDSTYENVCSWRREWRSSVNNEQRKMRDYLTYVLLWHAGEQTAQKPMAGPEKQIHLSPLQRKDICKVKLSPYRPWRPLGLREVEAPTFSDIRLIGGG